MFFIQSFHLDVVVVVIIVGNTTDGDQIPQIPDLIILSCIFACVCYSSSSPMVNFLF